MSLKVHWGNASSVGSKNLQAVGDRWIPSNVDEVTGARMEDAMMISMLTAQCLVFGVADGHGSIGLFCENHPTDSQPTVWFGGHECATATLESLREYLMRVQSRLDICSLSPRGAAEVLKDGFAWAQFVLEMRMISGSRLGTPAFAALLDHANRHFDPLEDNYIRKLADTSRSLLESKVLREHPSVPGNPVVMYRKRFRPTTEPIDCPAEYGTTLTAGMLLRRAQDNEVELHLAHVGDTDAFLLRRHPRDRIFLPYRLTEVHSCQNPDEVERLRCGGLEVVQESRFILRAGPFANSFQIMPSRSMGHSLLTGHGITWKPDVISVLIEPGDVLLLASDGLWSELAIRRPPEPSTVECARQEGIPHEHIEDLSALTAAEILTSVLFGLRSASNLALSPKNLDDRPLSDALLNEYCTLLLGITSPVDNAEILALGI